MTAGQLQYNPFENRLTVSNFRSTTDFEVQGNLNVTGALTFFQSQVGSIANHDTDALSEGTTNLYYTNERVDDRVAALINGGTGISATYNDAGNLLSLAVDFGEINTDNLTEGSTNRFFTQARTRNAFTYGTGIQHDGSGTISVTQSDINTDNITEGSTNLFFTQARARGAFSVTGDLGYNASTGVFSFTERTDAEVNGLADARIALNVGTNLDLSNQDTDDLSEGTTNLYYTDARADARVVAGITGKLDASAVSSFGIHIIGGADAAAVRTTLGLGTAATTAATAYATAAQGALADSATQPGDLATVATTGAYSDLTGTPTLGTAAATDSTAYATAAQGALADSALQAETITLATLKAEVAAATDFADFQTRIAAL